MTKCVIQQAFQELLSQCSWKTFMAHQTFGHQAIIWTNAGILLIGPLGINSSGILIEIHTFPFLKMHLKMSSGKLWPSCLGLNVLRDIGQSYNQSYNSSNISTSWTHHCQLVIIINRLTFCQILGFSNWDSQLTLLNTIMILFFQDMGI